MGLVAPAARAVAGRGVATTVVVLLLLVVVMLLLVVVMMLLLLVMVVLLVLSMLTEIFRAQRAAAAVGAGQGASAQDDDIGCHVLPSLLIDATRKLYYITGRQRTPTRWARDAGLVHKQVLQGRVVGANEAKRTLWLPRHHTPREAGRRNNSRLGLGAGQGAGTGGAGQGAGAGGAWQGAVTAVDGHSLRRTLWGRGSGAILLSHGAFWQRQQVVFIMQRVHHGMKGVGAEGVC